LKIINKIKKKLSRQSLKNIKAESEVYNIVKGDFIVKALFKFTHDTFVCFVMEYMKGGDFNGIL